MDKVINNDTSIENESSSDEDSSIPCFNLPPLFHGDKTENINEWLNKFELVAQKSKWDEETKLDISRSLLQGLARAWYTHTATNFQKSSWFEFSRAVRRHFQCDNRLQKHSTKRSSNFTKVVFTSDFNFNTNRCEKHRSFADELRNCKQDFEESVESYGKRVYDLIEMVNANKTMCEIEMAVNLIKGLRADLYKEVAMSNPTTFNQALRYAKIIESKREVMKHKEKENI